MFRGRTVVADNGMGYEDVVLGHDATIRTLRALTGKEHVG